MILGTGIDLCDIPRIRKAIESAHFVERVYTEAERARIMAASEHRRGEIAAGLFAAKEAVSKALGTGFDGFGPGDIEVLPDDAGRPVCALRENADVRARSLSGGAYRLHVAITHESGMAAAVAMIEA